MLENAVDLRTFDTAPARIPTILTRPDYPGSRCFTTLLLTALLCMAGCAHEEPLLIEDIKYFEGDMPADFSGSWARDYSRGDNINNVLQDTAYEMARRSGNVGPAGPMVSDRDMSRLMPLARLVELITRTDELTISQTEHEILVERREDFALFCAFFDGVAKPTESAFGRESCGWSGKRLISVQDFPDGLRVVHQFDTSDDREELRVITTASSDTSPMPFTVTYYYRRFEKIRPQYECIETLSMKRVCSTGKLAL